MTRLLVLISIQVFSLCADGNSTFQADDRSMEPTTLKVEEAVITDSSSTLNRRKSNTHKSNIWDWDYWCQLQPKPGNCGQTSHRYFYDAQLNTCQTFVYTGCNGNKNNFETKLECERYCTGSNFMPLRSSSKPKFCLLQPDLGSCLGLMTKYYYDIRAGTCKSFMYGGCDGNQNRFDTKERCLVACQDAAGENTSDSD